MIGDLQTLVHRAEKNRQRFEYRDFSAQSAPYTAHFEPDHTGADHAEAFRHFADSERASIGKYEFLVEIGAGQRARIGARRDDGVFGEQGLRRFARDLYLAAFGIGFHKTAATVEKLDFVFLEQVNDAVVILFDDLVLARQHLPDIDAQPLDLDAVLRELVAGVLEILRRLQQRLGRNAADVGAGAAERGPAV